jgi:RNA polymerase sigma-70 factor (ECF subfamily)
MPGSLGAARRPPAEQREQPLRGAGVGRHRQRSAELPGLLERQRERRGQQRLGERALTPDSVEADLGPEQSRLLDAYLEAFWRKDIDRIVELLQYDATWDMPPYLNHYRGAEEIGRLIGSKCPGGSHDMPMLRTSANGQPAFALYMRGPEGHFDPFHIQVLDLDGAKVRHVTAFFGADHFARFGQPVRQPADYEPALAAG